MLYVLYQKAHCKTLCFLLPPLISFISPLSPSPSPEELSALQLIAKPDYPVAAGQSVHLHCMALTMPRNVSWSWQRWKNQTWQKVGNGRDLTLTEPDQSGQYCCFAKSNSTFQRASPGHKVYIVSTHATGQFWINVKLKSFKVCVTYFFVLMNHAGQFIWTLMMTTEILF